MCVRVFRAQTHVLSDFSGIGAESFRRIAAARKIRGVNVILSAEIFGFKWLNQPSGAIFKVGAPHNNIIPPQPRVCRAEMWDKDASFAVSAPFKRERGREKKKKKTSCVA